MTSLVGSEGRDCWKKQNECTKKFKHNLSSMNIINWIALFMFCFLSFYDPRSFCLCIKLKKEYHQRQLKQDMLSTCYPPTLGRHWSPKNNENCRPTNDRQSTDNIFWEQFFYRKPNHSKLSKYNKGPVRHKYYIPVLFSQNKPQLTKSLTFFSTKLNPALFSAVHFDGQLVFLQKLNVYRTPYVVAIGIIPLTLVLE